jgi:predicted aspartyl protease
VKPKLAISLLLSLIALPGCASVLDEDGALAIAPYRIQESGRIVIDAAVNGHGPFAFALDTGATISVVFDDLRDELGLEAVPGKVLVIHGLVSSGQFPIVRVEQLQVGREIWANPRIASLPGDTDASAALDGLLGVDFLRHYAVGFSVRDNVVRLFAPGMVAERNYRGWTSIPLEQVFIGDSGAALYFLAIEIGGHRIPAVFDLGAGLNLINESAAQTIGLEKSASRDTEVLSGAIESTPFTARFRVDEVRTANVRWRNEIFRIAELELFTTLMQDNTPYAVLGADLFTQRDFVIDFTRDRLLVKIAMDEIDPPDVR